MAAVILHQQLGMDVAVDDAITRLLRAQRLADLDVHCRLSFAGDALSRSYVASGFSTSILRRKPCGIPFGMRSSPSNCQCGKSEENNRISSERRCSTRRSTSSGSDGPSNCWRVRRKLSRTISAGERSTHGTSVRAPRQNLEKRHRNPGSQVTPDSISTTFSLGYFANTPSVMRLATWP